MNKILSPPELIAVARFLTSFQAAITDYELDQYTRLNGAQRAQIEQTLALLAATAGRLYAYSVQLEFGSLQQGIQKLQQAADQLKKFLHTVQKIQRVLDAVSEVASLADAIMSHDVESIASGIDNIIQMTGND
jgi:ABC-type uncharacterized transport system fused permease/ATPase subunit